MFKKLLIISSLLISSQTFAYANLEAAVANVDVFVNQQTYVNGEVEYGIQNNTRSAQTYIVSYSLCPENKTCYSDEVRVSLQSGQREQKKIKVSQAVSYRLTGVYKATLSATIKGESNAQKTALGAVSVYNR